MKKILGLDLGTNSIGWALIQNDETSKHGNIIASGVRILPMSQDVLGKFDSGQSISQTAERTGYRGVRRLRERHLLRRERLHRVLNILGFLPEHYASNIDFEKKRGQFIDFSEPKLPYAVESENPKANFIFKESFNEMLLDFKKNQPNLIADDKKIPYDWTIYYLRKKALTQKIAKEELAWLLLNFNQKRGYYQLRGEESEENNNKRIEFYSLLVKDVIATDDKKGNDEIWYNVVLENGWIYRRTSKTPLEWTGKLKEFIVTTDVNEDGSIKLDKEGKEKRSFRAPDEKDWTLVKKKTENEIDKSSKTVGEYIYDSLMQNPNQKINGRLVRVIERKFYKSELESILNTQKQFHTELQDENIYKICLEELYENNEAHRNNIEKKDFTHLFLEDIIFYQRPLKSKKSLISNCKFENRTYYKNGIKEIEQLKCIAKSHPLFQEFRLWQFMQNLRILEKEKMVAGKLQLDCDVTNDFLKSESDWVNLFTWLNSRKEIDQKAFLKYPDFNIKKNLDNYRWNFVEDKSYPCNETKSAIKNRLLKVTKVAENFLDQENNLEALWHILYSVEDKEDLKKALSSFALKKNISEDFVEEFRKLPPFKKEYGSYSEKALKKLLPLMRFGTFWKESNIDITTKNRIEKIINAEYDDTIRDRVREKSINLARIDDFKGLPLWLASYIVYNRHSEDGDAKKWKTANDISFLEQHSLRNPIVEQVINETLQVVKDIWNQHGNGTAHFFDEIHLELGREMKNPAEKRKKMTSQITDNENTNLRIKALLTELFNDKDFENVRPYSPMQQEILKIYEEGVLSSQDNIPDDIIKISKQAQPSSSELIKYKLWIQQKYRSPYTGEIIPLSKLFTRAYDIEHIIPQSRYFDDSFSNKVICETEVNRDKDNNTAFEYIKNNPGKIIELSFGKKVKVFNENEYQDFIKTHYKKAYQKMKKLLMDDIPESFIQRQLNDTRYISKVVKSLLSNIVREEGETDAISKNVIVCNGSITSNLKQEWGLNDIWNELITPRFERLNDLTETNNFGEWTNKEGKRVFQTQVPLELQKGFNKKRIDHRHHALDAIVIASASRNHINYLNNQSALDKGNKVDKEKNRHDLKHKLCFKKFNDNTKSNYKWAFNKPWDSFTQDSKTSLKNIIVSFKQNLRVINKTTNYYQNWKKNENGLIKKIAVKQTKGDNWAIRKPMHKDTVSGLVKLTFKKEVSLDKAMDNWKMIVNKPLRSQIKTLTNQNFDKKKILQFFKDCDNKWNDQNISKVEIYYEDHENVASRVTLDESFTSSKIESITDTGIQKILKRHLLKYNDNKNDKITEHPELAFSADGLDEMNKNLLELNNGKYHHPIFKVRTFETKGNKFNIGINGNKKAKYVEAAKGTNLFFGIYKDENGKRNYETIPLNIVIERQKQGLNAVPEKNSANHQLLFSLSPNDLVYLPNDDEKGNPSLVNFEKLSEEQFLRLYKIVSFTGNRLYGIQSMISNPIKDKVEFSQLNKLEFSLEKKSIKEHCWKISTNRLGIIKSVIKN